MTQPFVICGLAGSLRAHSMNRGLLRAAIEVCPPEIEIRSFDLAPVPPYNADLEATGRPEPVQRMIESVGASDALLIATPEYNFSVPGVLKNALDWVSMPARESVLRQKPVALMGASSGRSGTMRCQVALRSVFAATKSHVMLQPELYVPYAAPHFAPDGSLTSEELKTNVRGLMVALREWALRITPLTP